MGHSGSTLADCILGTHQEFMSTGEMIFLGHQLDRTKNSTGSLSNQDVCTCEEKFTDCPIWSRVIENIKQKTNIDIEQDNSDFYIDPSKLHLVAGNPMRYKGRKKVKYDQRWKTELEKNEIDFLNNLNL